MTKTNTTFEVYNQQTGNVISKPAPWKESVKIRMTFNQIENSEFTYSIRCAVKPQPLVIERRDDALAEIGIEIDCLMAEIKQRHMGDDVTWDDVGSLNHILDTLKGLNDTYTS